MALLLASGALSNVAFAQNASNVRSSSFQAYVSKLANHRYESTKDVVDLLAKSVVIDDSFQKNQGGAVVLSQSNGFAFDDGINIDAIRVIPTKDGRLGYIAFNFNKNKCIYLQQIESGLGKFSGFYVWPEQINVYAKQLITANGIVYRAYMNRGPTLLPDCVVGFNVYMRGGYEKLP